MVKKTAFGFMLVAAILVLSVLSGCGGSGTSGTATSQNGFLLDSAVSGVTYMGDKNSSGITDSQGKFNFKEGEKETFKIGKVILGEVDMANALNNAIITPIELVEGKIKGTYDSSDYRNLKIMTMTSFLQSLDDDHDHTNGIAISSGMTEALDTSDTSAFYMSKNEMNSSTFDYYMKRAGILSSDYVDSSTAASHFQSDMQDGMDSGTIGTSGDGKHHMMMF